MLAAFGGAIFVGSPIFGYFADKGTSRQVPFIFGLLALGGSTIMFWVARSLSSLVIARVLQGLSAAVVWTVGMALVVDTVGKDQVGAAMGYVSMAMTVGTVFGPFIGGVVLSRISYDAVFTIAVGLVVLDILLRLFMIEQKTALKWTQPQIANETESDAVDRYGSRTIAFLGFLLDFPTFFLLRLITHDTTQDQILLYIFLFIAGIASTLQMVSLMTEVSLVVERQEKESPGIFGNQGGMGQAYGLFNVAWSGGQVLGPLIAGLLSDRGGWVTMVSVFGTMSGVTAVVIGFSDKKVLRCFGQRT
ncbi:hypothetical protein APSETT444_002031 [Aspergillus pseudonomiae]